MSRQDEQMTEIHSRALTREQATHPTTVDALISQGRVTVDEGTGLLVPSSAEQQTRADAMRVAPRVESPDPRPEDEGHPDEW